MKRQERDDNIGIVVWDVIKFFVLGCLLIGTPVKATIHTISNDSLPYVMTSDYAGDTVRISGTKITTTGSGINVQDGATDILFDFGNDTLEFGTDYGDSYYGINIDRSSATNITVRGGTILHGVQNCGISGVDTAYNCIGLRIRGCNGLFLDSTNIIVGGFDATVVYTTGYQSYKNLEVRGGHYRHDGCGYTSREFGWGEVFRLTYPSSNISGEEYHLKAYGVHIDNAIHGAFSAGGLQYIYRCTVTVDARNDLYSYPEDDFHRGTTQAYAFSGGPFGGSRWHDNLILTDSNYAGLDGGFLLGGVPDASFNGDTVWIYNNVVYGHRGLDSHYGYMNCKGVKSKGGNRNVRILNNKFYLTVDTDSTELGGDNFRGRLAIGVDWYAYHDSNMVFENNYFEVKNVSASGIGETIGLRMRDDFGVARNNGWRNNHINTSREIYSLGGYSPYGRNLLVVGDTVGQAGHVEDWRNFYCPSSSAYNNVFRDVYYDGVPDTSMVWVPGGSNSDITLQRMLQIYVMGNNDLPVAGAACSVWNNYGQLVIDNTTNSCGLVSGVVSYWFESYAGDSTAFNNFRIKAVLGSDTVVYNNFTVGYTTEGALDTLKLLNTTGFDDGTTDCEQQQANRTPSTPIPQSPVMPDSITTTTPVLYVYNSNDPDSDPLTYDFQLYDEGQTSLLASTDGLPEGSGVTGWQVPDGALVDSGIYSWRARSYDGAVHSSWSSWAQFGVLLLGTGNNEDTIAPAPVYIYAYPNPISLNNSEAATFTLPDYPVDLYITTVSGDVVLVRRGVSGEYKWYGENSSGNTVAVGVYLWYVRDTDQSGKVMVTP